MARKTWNLEFDGKQHQVVLEHGWISGSRKIWVDGKPVTLPATEASRWPIRRAKCSTGFTTWPRPVR